MPLLVKAGNNGFVGSRFECPHCKQVIEWTEEDGRPSPQAQKKDIYFIWCSCCEENTFQRKLSLSEGDIQRTESQQEYLGR